jgi:hypothetical protein
MAGWRNALNGDPLSPGCQSPTARLSLRAERSRPRLAEVNPSVRYFTLEE